MGDPDRCWKTLLHRRILQVIPRPKGLRYFAGDGDAMDFTGAGGVRLESEKVGGTRYVKKDSLDRFIAALNHRPEVAKPADQSREAERTERVLLAEGF